jgi:putative transcriptional regulator
MKLRTTLAFLATAVGCILAVLNSPAYAQAAEEPNTVVLVAAPNLAEPVYRQTVLIVTAIEGGRFIGIMLNRPTRRTLSSLFPEHGPSKAVVEPVFFGGPMSRSAIFALAKSPQGSGAGSIPLMKNLHLAITVSVVDKVIEETPNDARYYVGNVLWRPGELQDEIRRGVWSVHNADPDIVFNKDPFHLWEEMSKMTRGVVTSLQPGLMAAVLP